MVVSMLPRLVPMLTGYTIGIVLAVMWRGRCPKAATMALVASIVALAVTLASNIFWGLFMARILGSSSRTGWWVVLASNMASVIQLGCWLLLLLAVFTERRDAPPPESERIAADPAPQGYEDAARQ